MHRKHNSLATHNDVVAGDGRQPSSRRDHLFHAENAQQVQRSRPRALQCAGAQPAGAISLSSEQQDVAKQKDTGHLVHIGEVEARV